MIPKHPFITVVSGLPRSGTSLMMQMLAAGGMPVLADGIRTADSSNPRGYYEYEAVKRTRRDPSWLPAAQGKAVKVIYALLLDLPPGFEYRVILMRRDLNQVVASQRAMLESSGREGSSLSAQSLARALAEDLNRVTAKTAARFNFRVLEVQYLDCIRASAAVASTVNRFLDGTLDIHHMAEIPSGHLFRQRVGSPSEPD